VASANQQLRDEERQELESALARQLGFLVRGIQMYLDGEYDSAYQVATSIRVLVHDTKKSRSLLQQLGLKDDFFFWHSGCSIDRRNLAPQFPLNVMKIKTTATDQSVVFKIIGDEDTDTPWHEDAELRSETGSSGPNVYFAPRIETPPSERPIGFLPFRKWWSIPIVLEPPQRNRQRFSLNRKDLILAMANKDGGAHFDMKLEAHYAAITRKNSLGIFAKGAAPRPVTAPHEASAVQIGYEIFKTVQRWSPERIPRKLSDQINELASRKVGDASEQTSS